MVASVGMNQEEVALQKRIERFQMVREQILRQVREVIVGQQEVLDQILIAIFVGGHCLMTGLPGTAKTLMVRTVAEALGLKFRRIQFTPDLMPSDITGTDIIEEDLTTGHRKWTFVEGPIFGNVLLADEINRTPPKTQSALLEAMQEHSCAEDELAVIDLTTATRVPKVEAVTSAEELLGFQQLVRMVPIAEALSRYVVALVRATRPKTAPPHELVKRYVNYGGSVRAAQFIVLAAKARALSNKRYHVSYEDITSVVVPVLRHRILLNFHAESDQVGADEILKQLISHVKRPQEN